VIPTQIVDYTDRHDLFIEVLRNKSAITALMQSYLRQIQALEDGIYEVILERSLDTAVGVQLTVLGRLIGQSRILADDDRFRQILRARIRINRSEGTPEDILGIAILLLVSGESHSLREEPTAQFRLYVHDALTSADADLLLSLLKSAKPAGVRFLLQWSTLATDGEKFLFGDLATPFGGGFGDTFQPADGGKFEAVYA
jgi:hypothetical protein